MKKILCFCLLFSSLFGAGVEDLKKSVKNSLKQFTGWCSEEKAMEFIDLVLETTPSICVEIGVFGGQSMFPVASALKYLGNGVVIGIDPWDHEKCVEHFDPVADKTHIAWWNKVNIDHTYLSCLSSISRHCLDNQCITFKASSEQAVNLIDTIDILFIDGNKSQEGSLKDVELYLPKVNSGGYIWINDVQMKNLKPAVAFLLDHCEFIKLIDNGNCLLVRKS